MNSEESVYQKCGEIYFSKDNYTFLCYYCNNLFYEFAEFKTHSLLHADVFDSSDEINFIGSDADNKSINTNVVKKSYDESLNICDDDIKDDKELLNNIDDLQDKTKLITSSIETIKIEAVESFDQNKLTGESNENVLCNYCKRFVKFDEHNFKKCSKIQQTIITYKGDFIKLLRQGILCCSYCKRYFQDYKELYKHHIDTKHCIRKNQCKICKFFTFMNTKIQSSKDLNNLSDCDNECSEIQELPFEISCEKCSINFHSQVEYNLHLKTTHEAAIGNESETETITSEKCELPLKCSLCEKVFKTKYQKQIHLRIHTNDRPYKCELCSAAFTVATNLKNHIIYKHTEDRPFVCDYNGCNVRFKLLNLKKQHEKLHLPANFQCEICGNYYKSKFILLKHQQSMHVDSENWIHRCEICNKRFAHPEYLIDHKRIHTGEKPFGCDTCSKYFRKRSSLREHKKLHSDTKRYICRLCGKGFKQIAGYWSHMKRHPKTLS